jgi:signal transduction histidine kinase
MRLFDRLFLKVYATIVGTLLLVVFVSVAIWWTGPEQSMARKSFGMASGLATAALGDPDAPLAVQAAAIRRLSKLLESDLAVYDRDGQMVAAVGAPLPAPSTIDDERPRALMRNPVWRFVLGDGRQIVIRPPFQSHVRGPGFLVHLAVVGLMLAIGSFPVVRGLTRRLERLQKGVETFGQGNLTARVTVSGRDEVARVAESFNKAAARIEQLVNAHRMLLANASHELRTPLARLRLGVERLGGTSDEALRAGVARDIAELDALIDEILLTSRLEAMPTLEAVEDVDLLALAAEEASRYDNVLVSGHPTTVQGDQRLLRRIMRNLLENAGRHGKPPVEISVSTDGAKAIILVSDAGEGVAPHDRERVFEPFFRRSTSAAAETGTGLGLAIVRQIARLHGGEARLLSGSTFEVSLVERGS